MSSLVGKYAIVTGAAKGIGAAVVKMFIEEGISGVAMLDINEENLNETASNLNPARDKTLIVPCDISSYDQIKLAVQKVANAFGTIDILVNNAGITKDSMFHKMTAEQWQQVMNVNLNGTFYMCREVVPFMREQQSGKIVNISSLSAMGNIGQANYAATKSAILGLTYTLAKELGPKGINVNAIAPGFIETDMLSTVPESIQNKWKEGIPLRRFGSAEELANIVTFLSSDQSSWITSECITASGGVYSL